LWIDKLVNTKSIKEDLELELSTGQSLLKQLKQTILQEAIEGKLTEKWRAKNPDIGTAKELLEQIKTEKEKLVKDKKIKASKPLAPINEDEIPFDIPQSWEWCRFGEIAIIESNLVNPKNYLEYYQIGPDLIEKNTGKLLESRTVKESGIFSSNHYFFKNQLIYSKVRPKLNKVIIADYDGLCSADMYPIQSFIYNRYLQIVMLSEHFYWEVDKFDNRVKMPKINQNQLNITKIPTPPAEEQKVIVTTIEKLFAICDELESEINQNKITVNNLMATVLKEAFEN
ncbi:MAG: restriction endonuclease subunit S, partial [Arcobacter sp.]|nr:restriction endonuclease subunit S [Arcobacter sp.]